MSIKIEKLTEHIGACVEGVNVAKAVNADLIMFFVPRCSPYRISRIDAKRQG